MNPISLEMTNCVCWECGVPFAVSLRWLKAKMDMDETILCPNGHEFSCHWPDDEKAKDLKEDNERLRTELLREKHRAEQAEGRRRDASGIVLSDEDLSSASEQPPAPSEEITELQTDAHGRMLCPRCPKKVFKYQGGLERHLRKAHGDNKTAERVLAMVMALSAKKRRQERTDKPE